MTEHVTVICKTFERPRALLRCIDSIKRFYPNMPIKVADDSERIRRVKGVDYYTMPFDSGLSAGRNLLLGQVKTEFILLIDDDFLFTENTNIDKFYEVLLKAPEIDLVAGNTILPDGTVQHYEGRLRRSDNELKMVIGDKGELEGYPLYDLVLNFFMARTESIRKVMWDDDLKVSEHLDFFWRAKGVLNCTNLPEVTVLNQKTPYNEGYEGYRQRGHEFAKRFLEKHGLQRSTNFNGDSIGLV